MFGIDDMALATIGSGILSSAGGLLGGMMGSAGQSATNAQQMAFAQQQQASAQHFNATEAYKQREWQEGMASTAYQRSMADMKAAGLNPILAAGFGGSSGGGGATGSISPMGATLGNPGESMGRGVASAGRVGAEVLAGRQMMAMTEKDKAQTDLNKETERATKAQEALTQELNTKAKQDTATSAAQQHQIGVMSQNTAADTVNKGIQSMILSHDATTAYEKSRLAKAEADQAVGHGPGPAGQIGGTVQKWIGQLMDTFRDPAAGKNLTSPTDPRFWGMKGRPGMGGPSSEGLTIDIRR